MILISFQLQLYVLFVSVNYRFMKFTTPYYPQNTQFNINFIISQSLSVNLTGNKIERINFHSF